MTKEEQEYLNIINECKSKIFYYHELKNKYIDELGYDRYKEILIEQFQKDLDEFIENFPENKVKADFWFNDNYNEYCCSLNFDEDKFTDDDWNKIVEFHDKDKEDLVMFTSNHRLF